jgi:hypothetical protein
VTGMSIYTILLKMVKIDLPLLILLLAGALHDRSGLPLSRRETSPLPCGGHRPHRFRYRARNAGQTENDESFSGDVIHEVRLD